MSASFRAALASPIHPPESYHHVNTSAAAAPFSPASHAAAADQPVLFPLPPLVASSPAHAFLPLFQSSATHPVTASAGVGGGPRTLARGYLASGWTEQTCFLLELLHSSSVRQQPDPPTDDTPMALAPQSEHAPPSATSATAAATAAAATTQTHTAFGANFASKHPLRLPPALFLPAASSSCVGAARPPPPLPLLVDIPLWTPKLFYLIYQQVVAVELAERASVRAAHQSQSRSLLVSAAPSAHPGSSAGVQWSMEVARLYDECLDMLDYLRWSIHALALAPWSSQLPPGARLHFGFAFAADGSQTLPPWASSAVLTCQFLLSLSEEVERMLTRLGALLPKYLGLHFLPNAFHLLLDIRWRLLDLVLDAVLVAAQCVALASASSSSSLARMDTGDSVERPHPFASPTQPGASEQLARCFDALSGQFQRHLSVLVSDLIRIRLTHPKVASKASYPDSLAPMDECWRLLMQGAAVFQLATSASSTTTLRDGPAFPAWVRSHVTLALFWTTLDKVLGKALASPHVFFWQSNDENETRAASSYWWCCEHAWMLVLDLLALEEAVVHAFDMSSFSPSTPVLARPPAPGFWPIIEALLRHTPIIHLAQTPPPHSAGSSTARGQPSSATLYTLAFVAQKALGKTYLQEIFARCLTVAHHWIVSPDILATLWNFFRKIRLSDDSAAVPGFLLEHVTASDAQTHFRQSMAPSPQDSCFAVFLKIAALHLCQSFPTLMARALGQAPSPAPVADAALSLDVELKNFKRFCSKFLVAFPSSLVLAAETDDASSADASHNPSPHGTPSKRDAALLPAAAPEPSPAGLASLLGGDGASRFSHASVANFAGLGLLLAVVLPPSQQSTVVSCLCSLVDMEASDLASRLHGASAMFALVAHFQRHQEDVSPVAPVLARFVSHLTAELLDCIQTLAGTPKKAALATQSAPTASFESTFKLRKRKHDLEEALQRCVSQLSRIFSTPKIPVHALMGKAQASLQKQSGRGADAFLSAWESRSSLCAGFACSEILLLPDNLGDVLVPDNGFKEYIRSDVVQMLLSLLRSRRHLIAASSPTPSVQEQPQQLPQPAPSSAMTGSQENYFSQDDDDEIFNAVAEMDTSDGRALAPDDTLLKDRRLVELALKHDEQVALKIQKAFLSKLQRLMLSRTRRSSVAQVSSGSPAVVPAPLSTSNPASPISNTAVAAATPPEPLSFPFFVQCVECVAECCYLVGEYGIESWDAIWTNFSCTSGLAIHKLGLPLSAALAAMPLSAPSALSSVSVLQPVRLADASAEERQIPMRFASTLLAIIKAQSQRRQQRQSPPNGAGRDAPIPSLASGLPALPVSVQYGIFRVWAVSMASAEFSIQHTFTRLVLELPVVRRLQVAERIPATVLSSSESLRSNRVSVLSHVFFHLQQWYEKLQASMNGALHSQQPSLSVREPSAGPAGVGKPLAATPQEYLQSTERLDDFKASVLNLVFQPLSNALIRCRQELESNASALESYTVVAQSVCAELLGHCPQLAYNSNANPNVFASLMRVFFTSLAKPSPGICRSRLLALRKVFEGVACLNYAADAFLHRTLATLLQMHLDCPDRNTYETTRSPSLTTLPGGVVLGSAFAGSLFEFSVPPSALSSVAPQQLSWSLQQTHGAQLRLALEARDSDSETWMQPTLESASPLHAHGIHSLRKWILQTHVRCLLQLPNQHSGYSVIQPTVLEFLESVFTLHSLAVGAAIQQHRQHQQQPSESLLHPSITTHVVGFFKESVASLPGLLQLLQSASPVSNANLAPVKMQAYSLIRAILDRGQRLHESFVASAYSDAGLGAEHPTLAAGAAVSQEAAAAGQSWLTHFGKILPLLLHHACADVCFRVFGTLESAHRVALCNSIVGDERHYEAMYKQYMAGLPADIATMPVYRAFTPPPTKRFMKATTASSSSFSGSHSALGSGRTVASSSFLTAFKGATRHAGVPSHAQAQDAAASADQESQDPRTAPPPITTLGFATSVFSLLTSLARLSPTFHAVVLEAVRSKVHAAVHHTLNVRKELVTELATLVQQLEVTVP